MRPYLAIIRDSFHEALVSRVLWILLAATTVFLLLLLPVGIIEQAGGYLRDEDILNRDRLAEKIVAGGKSSQPSPGRRIWELLDEPTRQSLERKADPAEAGSTRLMGLAGPLQTAMTRPDFYREADWAQVSLPTAVRKLREQGLDTAPTDQVTRFNRLALEAAFPGEIAPTPPKQVQLAYFRWELGVPLPVEPDQLFPAVNQLLVWALGTLLGVAGVFVAVLVTASMIPQTFEAGPVDLLLSKPVSRIGLLLAKFLGGCAFIAINAAYFVCGLWLILGIRFGLWNGRLLWAIPLYLFLFAIYYGVSALAGIIWRNAIVSVVLTMVFWFICWSLGTAVSIVEQFSLNPRRIATIVPAGDSLIAADRSDVLRWSDEEHAWKPIFIGRDPPLPFPMPRTLVGPVYDPTGQRILALRAPIPGLGALQGANRLLVGKRADGWRREEGVTVPNGAHAILLGPPKDLLVASSQGLFRLEGDVAARQGDINLLGLHIALPTRGGRFANVGPKVQLRPLESAAIDPQTGNVALFDGTRTMVFGRDAKGAYRQIAERTLDRKEHGKIAICAGQVFLTLEDGLIHRYSDELKPLDVVASGVGSLPESAAVSGDGRYLAIVFRNLNLWLYDIREAKPCTLPLVGQGDISAVAFDGQKLLAVDRLSRVTEYDLSRSERGVQRQPSMPLVENFYRYALHPLYTIFPKPGQLNDTVTYALTSHDSTAGAVRLGNSQTVGARLDVWGPVWSNLAFLVVVLAIACGYIYRKDF